MELLRDGLQDPHGILSASTAVSTFPAASWVRPVLPEASQFPPDVMLHVGGCVFALHEEVLRLRWPWLHLQLQQLQAPDKGQFTTNGTDFKLHVVKLKDLGKNQKAGTAACPLQTITLLKPLLYTTCLAADHQRQEIEDEDSSSCSDEEGGSIDSEMGGRKRRRGSFRALGHKENENRRLGKKRARKRIEYVYTFKVRLLHESSARQTLKLAEQVTLDSWMELLVASAALTKEDMRRRVCDRLVDFLYELQPVQYQEAMEKIKPVWIQVIDDHDMLVRVVVALINNVRLAGFWRDLLDAMVNWLKLKFESPQVPSLRAMHQHFVTDWEPFVELSRVECFTNTPSANAVPLHVTLYEFGDFVLQARHRSYLANDPEFWIRGQLIVKYQPANRGGGVVTEETRIEYQHSRHQYCMWKTLVSSTPATSVRTTSPSDEGWVYYEDPVHSYYRRTLLQTTLFYSAPINVGSEVADILIVSEMQKLPVETLALVLCSDRLRVPEGEKTLLRCLNKMVFGLDVYHLEADAQLPRPSSGRIDDVTRLYRCVRWCFVPLDDMMQVLTWSSRALKLYEIIVDSLRDPNRSRKRRRPFGWRKFRDAYMTNETNLSEFEIEAGDLHVQQQHQAPGGDVKSISGEVGKQEK
ncbi:uncharacterized protein KRP23_4827 [Phytophthora ramorum]|uniref:uncharacterized protein n=1 Tax=Phytophthora ramorum TaxID=164328 RepID=UPI0030AA575D|nr:hypothetical protein KRP23_4827 [Phytophthora ramorum]